MNMKKSWHPLTMTNLERVWKAEQARDAEKKRIAELRQQLADERAREEVEHMAVDAGLKQRSDRLEWMYRGPMAVVDRDAYLLGKKIDKAVDRGLQAAEQEQEALASGPGALFATGDTDVAVDLAAKIREDPLFAIRKKEEERKRALLDNPMKLGQLRKSLEEDRRRRKVKKSSSKRMSRSPSPVARSRSPPLRREHTKRSHRAERYHQDQGREHYKDEQRGSYRDDHSGSYRERPQGSYMEENRHSYRDERHHKLEESRPPHRREGGKHGHSRSRSPIRTCPPVTSTRPAERRKVDSAELERRRQEMQQNATWAEGERDRRLRRAEQQDHKEQHLEEGKQHPKFIE